VRPDLITFDCYGTLIDWRQGIAEAFRHVLPEAVVVEEERLFNAYERAEAEVEGGPYRPYREVLAAAAARAVQETGDPTSVQVLGPAPSPLARLRGRYRFQLLLKGSREELLDRVVRDVAAQASQLPKGLRAVVDVNPGNLL